MSHKGIRESRHTPGPWRVVSEWIDDGDGSEVEIYSVSGPNPDDLILDQPIDLADAKLIALSPELLEALEDLYAAYLGQMSDRDFPGRPWTPERDDDQPALKAKALIEKARSK